MYMNIPFFWVSGRYPQSTLELHKGLSRKMTIIHNTVSIGKDTIVFNN